MRAHRLIPAALLLAVLAPGSRAASAQEAPTNLRVLPPGTSRQEVTRVMRAFTAALGVRCSTCHVGEEGQPLSTYDFASDDKPMKLKARAMMLMAQEINGRWLAELPERSEPALQVTCVTCHRGVARPQPIEEVVRETLEADGVEEAVSVYRALRERHFGGFAYDFTERPLLGLAEGLGEGRGAEARRLLELNLEFHARSAPTLFALARLHDEAGERERAIDHYRRGLEIQPGNQQAQRRLRELSGGDEREGR